MERDSYTVTECPEFEISTHTLTWSVTIVITLTAFQVEISTHTLTWSVT